MQLWPCRANMVTASGAVKEEVARRRVGSARRSTSPGTSPFAFNCNGNKRTSGLSVPRPTKSAPPPHPVTAHCGIPGGGLCTWGCVGHTCKGPLSLSPPLQHPVRPHTPPSPISPSFAAPTRDAASDIRVHIRATGDTRAARISRFMAIRAAAAAIWAAASPKTSAGKHRKHTER